MFLPLSPAARAPLPAARFAVAELLAVLYPGWSDAGILSEPGGDGAAFLALRGAVAAGSPDWLALASAFLSGEFRGWSDRDLLECLACGREFLAARRAVRLAELLA